MGSWPLRSVGCRVECTQTLCSAELVRWGRVGVAGGEMAEGGRAGKREAGGCSGSKSLSLLLFQQ